MKYYFTRQELYDSVWSKPVSHLVAELGTTTAAFSTLLRRADIPTPPAGHWMRKKFGKPIEQPPLPPTQPGCIEPLVLDTDKQSAGHKTKGPTTEPAATIDAIQSPPAVVPGNPLQTPKPLPTELPPKIKRQVDKVRSDVSALVVPERLLRPHAVIASWLAKHKEEKRRARNEHDPWMRNFYRPSEYTELDHRKHRILDTLFKAIERQGGKVMQEEQGRLFAEMLGEKVEFQIREKQKRERQPLTDDDKRWRLTDDRDWKQVLVPTGCLVFEFKVWQWPAGLPH